MSETRELLLRLSGRAKGAINRLEGDEHALYDALVEKEERLPGEVRAEGEELTREGFDIPDGPLHPVSQETQCERVARTAEQRWQVDTSRVACPRGIDELLALLTEARLSRKTLRVVGSARSLSRAPEPSETGLLVSTCQLANPLEIETDILRADVGPAQLYRAQAGRVLADVLEDLSASGRALADMGSGDFQALGGALSTSTHGSGVKHPAFPGLVRSLDIVTWEQASAKYPEGRAVKQRIEPTLGITDPQKFRDKYGENEWLLIQDDEHFNSWTVSLGCLGVIESIVIDVVPTYWLRETRKLEWWSDVQSQMPADLNQIDYYEVLIDPTPQDNAGQVDHRALVTRRNLVTEPAQQHPSGGRPITMKLAQTQIGRIVAGVELAWSIRNPLKRVPRMLHTSVTATQVESYTDLWFEVLLLRLDINADSSELGIPLTGGEGASVSPLQAIAAAQVILDQVADHQSQMSQRLAGHSLPFLTAFDALCSAWEETPLPTSPVSLRFVRGEAAYLSMQFAAPTCMMETPMPGNDSYDKRLSEGVQGKDERESKSLRLYSSYVTGRTNFFARAQELLRSHGVRPHWGQRNFMTWEKATQVYPSASKWFDIYSKANLDGTFNNPLTDQLGISQSSKGRP